MSVENNQMILYTPLLLYRYIPAFLQLDLFSASVIGGGYKRYG